jgi:hypothetical protein
MTALFRRINPAQKFRLTKHQIAKFLRIPESLIVKSSLGSTLSSFIARQRRTIFQLPPDGETWKKCQHCHCKNAPPTTVYNSPFAHLDNPLALSAATQ